MYTVPRNSLKIIGLTRLYKNFLGDFMSFFNKTDKKFKFNLTRKNMGSSIDD